MPVVFPILSSRPQNWFCDPIAAARRTQAESGPHPPWSRPLEVFAFVRNQSNASPDPGSPSIPRFLAFAFRLARAFVFLLHHPGLIRSRFFLLLTS
jgi:hypothetical protein